MPNRRPNAIRAAPWVLGAVALAAAAAVGLTLLRAPTGSEGAGPQATAQALGAARSGEPGLPAAMGDPAAAGAAGLPALAAAGKPRVPLGSRPLGAAAQARYQELAQLAQVPAGDAAIALGHKLEAGIRPDNMMAYVRALLEAEHPAVQRAAIGALGRYADGELMLSLAAEYGALPQERRGRILQVLESAANPAALPGLAFIVAGDTTEKRSPLVAYAMYGAANIGTMDSVQYLISQLTPQGADYALMALERVRSPQGVDMLRGVAAGNKDAALVPAQYRDAVRRIAENAGPD